jgi:hypothetical protein
MPVLFAAIAVTATPAAAATAWGVTCTGTETVQVGPQQPRTLPYEITISIDLDRNVYCYGACGKAETYDIADASSNPIKLANANTGAGVRQVLFNTGTLEITDYQTMMLGLGTVTRKAFGSCKPAPFHQPWVKNAASP